jgi:hypothetical protein
MDDSQQTNKAQQGIYKDKPRNYMRQQHGHSLIKHICLVFVVVGMFTIPYYSLSPNHYWHA